MSESIADYPVRIEIPVAWGEMDAFGHVNNVVYIRYFESARIAYFERMGDLFASTPAGIGPIMATVSCRFKIPLVYPDQVDVGIRVSEILDDRYTFEYAVFSRKQKRLAAKGDGVVVAYDYDKGIKATVPDEWRQRISEIEGREL